jgi:hypothetical protein
MTDFLLMVGGALFAMFVSGIVNYKKSVWVGLMDEELPTLAGDNGKVMDLEQTRRFYKVIEKKLKEKNT